MDAIQCLRPNRPPAALHSVAALAIGSDRTQRRGSQGDWGRAHVWSLMVVAQRRLGGFRHKNTRPGVVDRQCRPRSRLPRGAGNWTRTRLAAIKLHRLRVLGTEGRWGWALPAHPVARSCAGAGKARRTLGGEPLTSRRGRCGGVVMFNGCRGHMELGPVGLRMLVMPRAPPLPQTSARGRSQAVGLAVGGGLRRVIGRPGQGQFCGAVRPSRC